MARITYTNAKESGINKEEDLGNGQEEKKETKKENGRRVTGGWLENYASFTSNQESPEAFHFWLGLSILASALRRNVSIDRGFYTLYPNLYLILVAKSATCRKSVACGMAYQFLNKLRKKKLIRIAEGKLTPEGLIKVMGGGSEVTQGESTGEMSKGMVGIKPDSSMTIYCDELATMLSNQSYVDDLVSFFTDIFMCKTSYSYITRTKGQVHLHNTCLNIIGASTDEWLAKGLKPSDFGGGFVGRCIFVVQKGGKNIAWPKKGAELKELEEKLQKDLEHIAGLKGEFTVTEEAIEYYEKWYDKRAREYALKDKRMAGYLERKHDHILKIAMLLAVSDSDSLVVTLPILKRAFDVLNKIEDAMPEAFSYIGTEESIIGEQLLHVLIRNNGKIKFKDAIKMFKQNLKAGKQQFQMIVDTLIETGEVTCELDSDAVYWIKLTKEKMNEKGLVKFHDDGMMEG